MYLLSSNQPLKKADKCCLPAVQIAGWVKVKKKVKSQDISSQKREWLVQEQDKKKVGIKDFPDKYNGLILMAISRDADSTLPGRAGTPGALSRDTQQRALTCPHRGCSFTAHLKTQGTFDFTASPMLSEVGTDMHTQKRAAESYFTMKPHHNPSPYFC